MPTLQIVWRNPNKVQNRLRYSSQTHTGDRHLYTVQQMLSEAHDVWVNTSVLEVISRPPTPPTQQGVAHRWHFGFGS